MGDKDKAKDQVGPEEGWRPKAIEPTDKDTEGHSVPGGRPLGPGEKAIPDKDEDKPGPEEGWRPR